METAICNELENVSDELYSMLTNDLCLDFVPCEKAVAHMASVAAIRDFEDSEAVPTIRMALIAVYPKDARNITDDRIREALERERDRHAPEVTRSNGLPDIVQTPPEHIVVGQMVKTLEGAKGLYQRGTALARIQPGGKAPAGITRPAEAPTIKLVEVAELREILSSHANYYIPDSRTKAGRKRAYVQPALAQMVYSRGVWPLDPLEAVIAAPVLRPDGTILTRKGYDKATGLYLTREWLLPSLSIDDARAAIEELIIDFPFASDAHKAAFVAMFATPFARYAINDCVPMCLVDGNKGGTGKTLLLDVIGYTFTGASLPRADAPGDNAEWKKVITTFAREGDTAVVLDNINGTLESNALDAALTARVWQDRILGKSEAVRLPLNWTVFGSGVNIQPGGTIGRRVVVTRLETPHERPEERTDFTHPDLLAYVVKNRPRFVAAILKILTHYCEAGRPDRNLPGFGSFQQWSDLVRSAVVHAGWADPCITRAEFAQTHDPNAEFVKAFGPCWFALDVNGRGLTVSEVFDRRLESPALIRAFSLIASDHENPNTVKQRMGKILSSVRSMPAGGFRIDRKGERNGSAVWQAYQLN